MANFAFDMTRSYDIKVRTVHDYNQFIGVEDIHAQVSVIHYDELSPISYGEYTVCSFWMMIWNSLITVLESTIIP